MSNMIIFEGGTKEKDVRQYDNVLNKSIYVTKPSRAAYSKDMSSISQSKHTFVTYCINSVCILNIDALQSVDTMFASNSVSP
mmetsp:Transcript_43989/g.51532  ORF Transcript_43989/g.51532 Transcript_43989/m.51532 type:complete len:82 (-) Transcript_43989:270-515(-)